jgi:hypothetical protein
MDPMRKIGTNRIKLKKPGKDDILHKAPES